jgi:hypothetical protein
MTKYRCAVNVLTVPGVTAAGSVAGLTSCRVIVIY